MCRALGNRIKRIQLPWQGQQKGAVAPVDSASGPTAARSEDHRHIALVARSPGGRLAFTAPFEDAQQWEQRRIARYYLHRWPSARSMQRARLRIKAFTGRHRSGAELKDLIAGLNLFLRGWGNYFRTGNASTKFIQLDRYVVWRLKRLLIKKRGRNLGKGPGGLNRHHGRRRDRGGPATRHGSRPLPQPPHRFSHALRRRSPRAPGPRRRRCRAGR